MLCVRIHYQPLVIPHSSVHDLQSFACQFNTGKLVTKV